MKTELFLGFDTSNYTTSAALCGEDGKILKSIRLPLSVEEGARGLRQSDALFGHVKAMPSLAEGLRDFLYSEEKMPGKIAAIGCSVRPRDAEGSYMPCFLPGYGAGELTGALLGVPVYHISHQRGHIAAALHGAGAEKIADSEFLAFHVSGGTTDLLRCIPDGELVIKVQQIGGTLDINAGQLIDRCGVKMGLRFPAGPEMERLAAEFTAGGGRLSRRLRISAVDMRCNLSGAENTAAEVYEKTGSRGETAAFVIDFIGRTLLALRNKAFEKFGRLPVLYAGGVMSCQAFRAMLSDSEAYFAPPELSADNAAGTALLARRMYLMNNQK